MTFKLMESTMGSKDTVLRKFRIFAPSEGPKLLFQFLFLTIIDNNYEVVSRVLLLRKISNPDYSGVVAGMSYLNSKTVKEIRPPNFFLSLLLVNSSFPLASMISHISTLANLWIPRFPL